MSRGFREPNSSCSDRARGDADPDSDMDVLVILDRAVTAPETAAVSECAWEACLGQGILLTPVVVSHQEWENGIVSFSLLRLPLRRMECAYERRGKLGTGQGNHLRKPSGGVFEEA